MPYVESIVLESVRVFMGRTFSIPHRALRDTTLQGYYIPKVNILKINRKFLIQLINNLSSSGYHGNR